MTTKYKFVETLGCTAFNFSVNGKSLVDITEAEQMEILDYLFEQIKEGIKDGSVQLPNVVQVFSSTDWDSEESSCEQCGDSVSWTTWEI